MVCQVLPKSVDTSTYSNWITHQVGEDSPASGKWKAMIGGADVNNTTQFYLATNYFAYPSTTLELTSPANDTDSNVSDVDFSYFINSTNLDSCMLWIANDTDWQVNLTNSTPTNDTTNNFTQSFSDGAYIWNVECNGTFQGTSFSDFNGTNIIGENIYGLFTYGTFICSVEYFNKQPQIIFDSWRTSIVGHNENMLNVKATKIGLVIYTEYNTKFKLRAVMVVE